MLCSSGETASSAVAIPEDCGLGEAMSDMEEFEEDEETLAAIDLGIKAAAEGRVVTLEEVRKMIQIGRAHV